MQQYFGTDGIRGRVGDSLINPEFFSKLGKAVGKVLRRDASDSDTLFLIGRDTRESGAALESALQAGLMAAGMNVVSLGTIPTPAVAYLTQSLGAVAGAVISASHNPYNDNGVKFFNHQGMKLSDALELAIEAELASMADTAVAASLGAEHLLPDAKDRYVAYCKSIFPADLSLEGLRCVVDCAHGAAFEVAPAVFRELGAELILIGCEPNGVNINECYGATALQNLQDAVLAHQADIGIAFDGDADRLMLVDEQGEVVDGDEIICILALNHELKAKQGIVGTVMSNLGLEQALVQQGLAFERTRVGDRFVLEKLLEKGWTLGGENSGHIVNLDYATTGDGIISALQVLCVMQAKKQSLHHLKQLMTKRPQVLINVELAESVSLDQYPEVQQAVQQAEVELADRGRVLIRPSGTQPLIRVMVEGNDAEQVQQTAQSLAEVVRSSISGDG